MSKAPSDVASYDGSGDWFKVFESGLCGSNPSVDTDWCTWQKDRIEFTIPQNIPPGEYLVRVEHIGIHEGHVGKAQFYMECAQLKIDGPGGGTPSPLAKIPGIYSTTDPGIDYNKWTPNPAPYVMPGPAVWGGGGSAAKDDEPIVPPSGTMAPPSGPSDTAAPPSPPTGTVAPPSPPSGTVAPPSGPSDTAAPPAPPSGTVAPPSPPTDTAAPPSPPTGTAAPPSPPSGTGMPPAPPASSAVPVPPSPPGTPSAPPAPPTVPTSPPAVPSNPPTQPPGAPGGGDGQGAPLYGQCGGINHDGPTTCAEGTCTEVNEYYSQCI